MELRESAINRDRGVASPARVSSGTLAQDQRGTLAQGQRGALEGRRYAGARWFIHGQGITLGPYADQQILTGLADGDFLPSNRVFTARDGSWITLETHPHFASSKTLLDRPREAQLEALPSPRLLRAKGTTLRPAPEAVEEPTLEMPARAESETNPDPAWAQASPIPEPVATEEPVAMLPVPPLPVLSTSLPQALPELLTPVDFWPKASEPAPIFVPESVPMPEADFANFEVEHFTSNPPPPKSSAATGTSLSAPAYATPVGTGEIPPRPEFAPVFLADPLLMAPAGRSAEPHSRVIQLEFKLPERPVRAALFLALALATLVTGAVWVSGRNSADLQENKTRGLNDSRLSDPSSPTIQPIEGDDPIPPLKAPARPQRE